MPPKPTPGEVVGYGNPLAARTYSSDNASNVFVILPGERPDGFINSFQTWNQPATGSAPASAGLNFHAYVLHPTATPGEYTVLFDSGQLTVPQLTDPAGEIAIFPVADLAVQAGDRLAFYGRGIPLDIGTGSDSVFYPVPAGPAQGGTITPGSGGYPTLNQARTYSFGASVFDLGVSTLTGGMRKFVNELPGLGAGAANNIGQYISVATPDTTTYPGSDYYEIALVEFEEQMHEDLPPTKLRGYVQLETQAQIDAGVSQSFDLGNGYVAVDPPHYLGAAIVTQKDRPVRIKFYNLLPTGAAVTSSCPSIPPSWAPA